MTFENEACFAHRMKVKFLSSLWSWANLYSVDNTNSFWIFFDLVGVQVS